MFFPEQIASKIAETETKLRLVDKLSLKEFSRASSAPATIASISIPAQDKGKRLTEEKTEYLPPTMFGMTRIEISSLSATAKREEFLSVIIANLSLKLLTFSLRICPNISP